MPAIAAVQGFALRGQQPPPMASAFDVRADRSMGEMAWLVREAPTPSKRPSPYISIGGDMLKKGGMKPVRLQQWLVTA